MELLWQERQRSWLKLEGTAGGNLDLLKQGHLEPVAEDPHPGSF